MKAINGGSADQESTIEYFSPSPSSYLDEYQKLVNQMNNTPRVVVDNAASPTATVVKVDSAQNHGILLEAVKSLADLNLSITKAYISSDGCWSMHVFHVTDRRGRKLPDDSVLSLIEQSLLVDRRPKSRPATGRTALELTGADRPGLLSEVFAVLADLRCCVTAAKMWTHNGRIAAIVVVDVANHETGSVEKRLRHVMNGVRFSAVPADADRRLHQMMFEDRDYDRGCSSATAVTVCNWAERGYSVVGVQCRDRAKLVFDVVCTLTDMGYVVFHGTVGTDGDRAYQEFYIRHLDGTPIRSEAERQRVIQCLQAAIERRSSDQGIRVELRTEDRHGLLADVTRAFRENGLLLRRAEASIEGHMATNVFYVTDASSQLLNSKAIETVRQKIGVVCFQIKEELRLSTQATKGLSEDRPSKKGSVKVVLLYLGNLVTRNLNNLGLI